MPRAVRADLDVIAEDGFAAAAQPVELCRGSGAATSRRKSGPEDIGDFDRVGGLADGTALTVRPSDVARRTEQLRMGIAHLFAAEAALLDISDDRVPHEAVFDMGSAGRVVVALLVRSGPPGRRHRRTG